MATPSTTRPTDRVIDLTDAAHPGGAPAPADSFCCTACGRTVVPTDDGMPMGAMQHECAAVTSSAGAPGRPARDAGGR